MVTVHYGKRIETKFSRRKRHLRQGLGETRHELPVISPSRAEQTLCTSPTTKGGNMHSIDKQGNSPSPNVQGLSWGSGPIGMADHFYAPAP